MGCVSVYVCARGENIFIASAGLTLLAPKGVSRLNRLKLENHLAGHELDHDN